MVSSVVEQDFYTVKAIGSNPIPSTKNMKKVTKPSEQEEAVYFSDFSGKPLGQLPMVELSLAFSYGSKYDCSSINLNLSDQDAEEVLEFLKSKISKDSIEHIQKLVKEFESKIEDSIQDRSYSECDILYNNIEVFKKLL